MTGGTARKGDLPAVRSPCRTMYSARPVAAVPTGLCCVQWTGVWDGHYDLRRVSMLKNDSHRAFNNSDVRT
jgi:hypothetical protein